MRTLALVCSVWSSVAAAQAAEVELFTDKGDVFIKAGTNAGAEVGTELTILGDKIANTEERRRVGSGTVMEVWPTLARLALDDAARADKAAKKYVALLNGKLVTGAPVKGDAKPQKGKKDAAAAPGAAPAAAPAAPPAAAPAAAPSGGALSGHATFGGAGPWKLLRLWNDGSFSWSSCSLALMPGNRVYKMPRLKAKDVESVALSNFEWKGPEIDVTHTWVDVKCAEGSAKFTFPD